MTTVLHSRCRHCDTSITAKVDVVTASGATVQTSWCHVATDTLRCRGLNRDAEPATA